MYHSSLSSRVFENEDYQRFMAWFGPETIHMIDCKELNEELPSRFRAQWLNMRYRMAYPNFYPLSDPVFAKNSERWEQFYQQTMAEFPNSNNAELWLEYNLYPPKSQGFNRANVLTEEMLIDESE